MSSIITFREFIETPRERFVDFDKKILIIGYGSVGQAILPIILKHISSNPKNITVLEKDDHSKLFKQRNKNNGVQYVRKQIVAKNLDSTLSKSLEDGGFLIDVSLNIDAQSIMKWCFQHNVMYINTSLERWEHHSDEKIKNLADRTLYATHKEIR